MELQTISQVSKAFNISTRTLRYYEKIGLLSSVKVDDYAYRTYDEKSIIRLQKIIILRKLRIPLRQISDILKNEDAELALEVFLEALREIDDEITALSTIKSILNRFINQLNQTISKNIRFDLFGDKEILKIVDALTITKINFKEEKSMSELNKANTSLNKLQDKDVRIIYLPPGTVAAAHYIGENPEENSGEILAKFIQEYDLIKIKNDARVFGFNHPNPREDGPYGYETWVTIPPDMDVPAPLLKKSFPGGLYAAHMIRLGDFHEWGWLHDWVKNNTKYDDNAVDDSGECMHGLLEEHLNYLYYLDLGWPESAPSQLDLLYPIKPKVDFK